MLLVDDRESEKIRHKILIRFGDAEVDPRGKARIMRLKSADYILGDWGVEAKEINDLYRSIMGFGRTRTIVGQLRDLCDNFEKPFLVVYNTELKPWIPGGKPTARQISEERTRMRHVIRSFKMTMHHRFPELNYMQLHTMDDFVDWLDTNHRQNLIARHRPRAGHVPPEPQYVDDPRVGALVGCGISIEQAQRLLNHYETLPRILQRQTKQKDMMEAAGISRKQAKAVLNLREKFRMSP